MSKRIWHSGPPPHIGWWNASVDRNADIWRWWDGKRWSHPACQNYSALEALNASMLKLTKTSVEWTDYWPKGARVPRVDPRIGGGV